MTIETGPAPSGVKSSASPEANAAKGRAGASSNAKESQQPGGFSAILDSLGDGSGAVQAAGDSAGMEKPGDTTDAPMDAMALLAQSQQLPPPPGDGVSPPSVAAGRAVAGNAGKDALATPDALASNAAGQSAAGALGLGRPSKLPKGMDDAPASTAVGNSGQAATAQTGDVANGKDVKFLATLEALKSQPVVADVAAAAPLPAATVQEKGGREKSDAKSAGGESTAAPQGMTSATAGLTSISPTEGVTPTDMRVAEQVAYWISNDVQNAEMKLDGLGDKPVEVSISMQGNEAQVAFRTDESHTREMLENASGHLRDMLQREGVVLTGVSVGTSGAGDSGGQERRPRQGGRQAFVEVAQPVSPASRPAGAGGVGRAIDLFV